MDVSLGYYAEIALLFLPLLKSPDVILHLIGELQKIEDEEAREYHMKRICNWHQYPISDVHFENWMTFNAKQYEIIDDIKMLNDPTFWELHVHDWEGTVIERRYIGGYSYVDPSRKPWWRPNTQRRFQKLDLLQKEYPLIKNIWYKRQRYGNIFRIKFAIDQIDTDDFSDDVHEIWYLGYLH